MRIVRFPKIEHAPARSFSCPFLLPICQFAVYPQRLHSFEKWPVFFRSVCFELVIDLLLAGFSIGWPAVSAALRLIGQV